MNEPAVKIYPAGPEQETILRNLMHLYLYDFSEFTHDDTNEAGWFEDEHLPLYWTEPGRFPFLIMVNEHLAGFALVRDVVIRDVVKGDTRSVEHHMAEFFIMRKYRRQNIGKRAAFALFNRFPGRWLVAQIPANLPAQRFWRKIITEYTGGMVREVVPPGWDGPAQEFFVTNILEGS